MPWWMWALLGLALLGGEMLTPGGFYFLFFAVSSLVVAAVVRLGWGGPAWFQWLLFSVIAVVALVPLRSRFVRWISPGEDAARTVDPLVGELALLLDDIPAGDMGKVELRGSSWSARNASARDLRKGERARVGRVEGLTLWVEATK